MDRKLAFIAIAAVAACAHHRDPTTDPDAATGDGSGSADGATGDAPPEVIECTGVTVPGDYASLQTALDAVANAGQDATICLGEGTLSESSNRFMVSDPGHHGRTLHLVGRGRELTHLAGYVETTSSGWGSVTIEHLAIDAPNTMALTVLYGPPHFEATDLKITGALAVDAYYLGSVDATIDRCEIGTQQQGNSVQIVSDQKPVVLRITNSYVHGRLLSQTYQTGLHATLALVNNTFVGASTAIDLENELTATIANNIITGATEFAMAWDANTTVTGRNNALWGNAANYDRYATEGTSTVKTDCDLDGRVPVPGTGASSPCRNAGDASVAPAHDFYGAARSGAIDIGAVEAP